MLYLPPFLCSKMGAVYFVVFAIFVANKQQLMEWGNVIIGFVSALVSGGGLLGIVYYKENKRAKQLANDEAAAAQWRSLYEHQMAKNEALNAKIDRLYNEATALRNENNELTTLNAKLTIFKCERIECERRQPPINSNIND